MKDENITDEELAEAKTQLCLNICSNYDPRFNIHDLETSLLKMTLEAGIPQWELEIIENEFQSIDYLYGQK